METWLIVVLCIAGYYAGACVMAYIWDKANKSLLNEDSTIWAAIFWPLITVFFIVISPTFIVRHFTDKRDIKQ